MQLIYGIGIAILGIGMVVFLRLITTLFHELGHAIPALLFTDKKVEVYIGSYGNIENSSFLKFGRLEMYFKVNLFNWRIGMCRHNGQIKEAFKNVLIILGGPIASLLISMPIIINLKNFSSNDTLFFLSLVFICSAIIDLVVNLIPSSNALNMHDGSVAYSDGFQLMNLIARKRMPGEYFEFEKLYEAKEYEALMSKGKSYLEINSKKRFVYDFMINALIHQNKDTEALEYYTALKNNIALNNSDYYQIGKLYNNLGNHKEALRFLNHSFHYNFQDPELTNEMGLAHLELGNLEEAFNILTTTINKAPHFSKAYLNRARISLKNYEYTNCKLDLDATHSLDDKNPDLYYYYGILFERKGEDEKAVSNFEKALTLGSKKHGIVFKIESLKSI